MKGFEYFSYGPVYLLPSSKILVIKLTRVDGGVSTGSASDRMVQE